MAEGGFDDDWEMLDGECCNEYVNLKPTSSPPELLRESEFSSSASPHYHLNILSPKNDGIEQDMEESSISSFDTTMSSGDTTPANSPEHRSSSLLSSNPTQFQARPHLNSNKTGSRPPGGPLSLQEEINGVYPLQTVRVSEPDNIHVEDFVTEQTLNSVNNSR